MDGEPRSRIEALRQRIEDSEAISDDDRENLLEFSRQVDLLSSEYSDLRHEKLLRHCTRIAENVGGLADALEDREAAEDILQWINATYDNEETNSDYRTALRVFSYRVLKADEPPEAVAWVPTGTSQTYDPMPDRSDMLDWDDDILPMIEEGARNPRDRALIAVAYESGTRPKELYDLQVGDVSEREAGLYLSVSGKTGSREVLLIGDAIAYLQRWLSEHPASYDGDAWLWSKLNEPERASYPVFLRYFKKAADRASVSKPVTPRNFRKSNAYWLAKRGAPSYLIEDRQGRTRGSKHVSRYISRFGRESDDQYRGLFGEDPEDSMDPEEMGPYECSRCGELSPRHKDECEHCGLPFDPLDAYKRASQGLAELQRQQAETHGFPPADDPEDFGTTDGRIQEMGEAVADALAGREDLSGTSMTIGESDDGGIKVSFD